MVASMQRRPWKKRYHELTNQEAEDLTDNSSAEKKRARKSMEKRVASSGCNNIEAENGPSGNIDGSQSGNVNKDIHEELTSDSS